MDKQNTNRKTNMKKFKTKYTKTARHFFKTPNRNKQQDIKKNTHTQRQT